MKRFLPGLAVLIIIGLAAYGLANFIGYESSLIVSIILGIIIGNLISLPDITNPGTRTDTLWLKIGIILMGVSISVHAIINAGIQILLVVTLSIIITITIIEFLSRKIFTVTEKVGSLLAAGSSICGVSAVAAVSGVIKPNEKQVAYASATIIVFDIITIAIYPVIGSMLGLSDIVYGIWAGTTMFSTGPVAAAGFIYSDQAGEWAILVKLVRNTLIGLLVVFYAIYYNQKRKSAKTQNNVIGILETFPKFIIAFLVLMIISNLGVLNEAQINTMSELSNWMFLFAFAGLGLRIDIKSIRETGILPVAIVGITLLIVSAFMLLVVRLLF